MLNAPSPSTHQTSSKPTSLKAIAGLVVGSNKQDIKVVHAPPSGELTLDVQEATLNNIPKNTAKPKPL